MFFLGERFITFISFCWGDFNDLEFLMEGKEVIVGCRGWEGIFFRGFRFFLILGFRRR